MPEIHIENFFIAKSYVYSPNYEFCETLFSGSDIKIERIISSGHTTPETNWYDQPTDEWVILLSGSAVVLFEDGREIRLNAGDYITIPAQMRHRIVETSVTPKCFWLAVHGKRKA